MDRPDAAGHFRRRWGVSSPAQERHAGAPCRGAPWPVACRATGRSVRGYRAGHFAGGAFEASHLGHERPVCALAVRDRPQQADRFAAPETAPAGEVAAQLNTLPARQRDVLQSIAVESASIKDTAKKFSMSEGAVRVALHRGLASLTARLKEH